MSGLKSPGKKPDPLAGLRERNISLHIDLNKDKLFNLNNKLGLKNTKWSLKTIEQYPFFKHLQKISNSPFSEIETLAVENPFDRPEEKLNYSLCFNYLKQRWEDFTHSNCSFTRDKEIVAIKPPDRFLQKGKDGKSIRSRIWIWLDVRTGEAEIIFLDKYHDAWWDTRFRFCKFDSCNFSSPQLPHHCQ